MIPQIIGVLILIGFGYWIYKSFPPMDPKLKEPLTGKIDWDAIGIDPNDTVKRREYLDALFIKVKTDLENRTKNKE